MKKFCICIMLVMLLLCSVFVVACGDQNYTIQLNYDNITKYFNSFNGPSSINENEAIVIELGQLKEEYSECKNFQIFIDGEQKIYFDITQNLDFSYTCVLNTEGLQLDSYVIVKISGITLKQYEINLYSDDTKTKLIDSIEINHGYLFKKEMLDLSKIPSKTGYDIYIIKAFDNIDLSEPIVCDVDLYVHYLINTYTVRYYEDESLTRLIEIDYVDYNNPSTPPKLNQKEGYKFIGWSDNIDNVVSDLNVYPLYEKMLKIEVYDYEGGNLIESTYVEKGGDFVLEKTPHLPGLIYNGIIGDTTNIQEDKIFYVDLEGKILNINYDLNENEFFADNLKTETLNTKDLFDAGTNGVSILTPLRDNCYFSKWMTLNDDVVGKGAKITYFDIMEYIEENGENLSLSLKPYFIDNSYIYNNYEFWTDSNNKQWLVLTYFTKLKDGNTFEVPKEVWNGEEYIPVYSISLKNASQINAEIINVNCEIVDFSFASSSTKLKTLIIGDNVKSIISYGGFNTIGSTIVEIILLSNTPKDYGTLCFGGIKNYQIKVAENKLSEWQKYYPNAIAL